MSEEKEEQKGKRMLDNIQDRMNTMDIGKRKRILYFFVLCFIVVSTLRLFSLFRGCSEEKEERSEDAVMHEDSIARMQQEVLDIELTPKVERSKSVEDLLDQLVEQDRKEKEVKDGTTEE